MKNRLKTLVLLSFIILSSLCFSQEKASVNMADKSFWIGMDNEDLDKEYKIFGYASPDASSKKMILFSIFTSDVEKNPYKCEIGAFYESTGLNIQYVSTEGTFVKMKLVMADLTEHIFYIELKDIEFY